MLHSIALVLALLPPVEDAEPTTAPAAVAAIDTAHAAGQSTVHPIEWQVQGVAHRLEVRWKDDDLSLVGRKHETLRSAVGPMLATLYDKQWVADNGGYRTLEVRTEYQGNYRFDLLAYLEASGQSGGVLRQLLENGACELAGDCGIRKAEWPTDSRCPTVESVEAWDGGFAALTQLLVDTRCFDAKALAIEPTQFWVDDWDGHLVTVAVQRTHCKAARSACAGSFSYVNFKPPPGWSPWLKDARSGKGYMPRTGASDEQRPSEDPRGPKLAQK